MLGFKKFFEERAKAKADEESKTQKEPSVDAESTKTAAEPSAAKVDQALSSEIEQSQHSSPHEASAAETPSLSQQDTDVPTDSRRQRRDEKAREREAEIQARQSLRVTEKTERRTLREEAREKARIERELNPGLFTRVKKGLSRTSANFAESFGKLLLGKKTIDSDLMEEIETQLLLADVGIEATTEIIANLAQRVERKQLLDSGALYAALQEELQEILEPCDEPLLIDDSKTPYVILVVGVNGVGKTTTIGKMAKRFQSEGKSVLLAAGDTFRAAAVEQLQIWGERHNIPVVAQHMGADSASVIFDAMQSAKARNIDIVIADTAGRLHNKSHLMDELSKVTRVMGKLDDSAPHEVMLVLDAGTGQNALSQTEVFQQAVGVSGIILTKLDGTAKGGIIFALCRKFKLPVRFIGVGEQADDLRPFNAEEFIQALFATEHDINSTAKTVEDGEGE